MLFWMSNKLFVKMGAISGVEKALFIEFIEAFFHDN